MRGTELGFAVAIGSAVFFVVGLTRVVEFDGIGLSKTRRRIFAVAHCIGCALFSAAMAIVGLDTAQNSKSLSRVLFFSALVILMPLHIYVGLRRRIIIRDAQDAKDADEPKTS